MSSQIKPFQKLPVDVDCRVRSEEWNQYRSGMTYTTFLYGKDEVCFLTSTRPPDSVPFETFDREVCGLPWLRTGAHCGHERCYSLLRCRQVKQLSGRESFNNSDESDQEDGSVQSDKENQTPPVSVRRSDGQGPDSSSLWKVGVPYDILTEEYSAWMCKKNERVYLTRSGDKFLLSGEALEGEDSPSLLMIGPEAKQACQHKGCAGLSWCLVTGWCEHQGCKSREMCGQSGRSRCHLPKPRLGPHCLHKGCPSLLKCSGGRPIAKPGSAEPSSPRSTRSKSAKGSSDDSIAVPSANASTSDASLVSPPLVPNVSSGVLPSLRESVDEGNGQESSFLDIPSYQSMGLDAGSGSSATRPGAPSSPLVLDSERGDSPFDGGNGPDDKPFDLNAPNDGADCQNRTRQERGVATRVQGLPAGSPRQSRLAVTMGIVCRLSPATASHTFQAQGW
ncbi:hypothetical protein B0O80DRAFT_527532 [Mortierella sp. GBAus27b]|nr:hypothetical protein B0O80DRAFT_527532 [Mortierella sp. GBAus27b]